MFELVRHLGGLCPVTLICPNDFQFRSELQNCEGVTILPVLPSPVAAEGHKSKLLLRLIWQTICGTWLVLTRRKDGRLVHVNFPGLTFLALPALLLWRIGRKRILLTVHDVVPHQWLFPRVARSLEWGILWACYHTANQLVVLHSGARVQLVHEFGVVQQRISVIPHGTFSFDSAPLPLPENQRTRTALLFGSLRANKGIHLAIEAVQQLRREGLPIVLQICGSVSISERKYWERCRQLIDSAPDGIRVLDRCVSDDELLDFLRSSHFAILPYSDFNSQSGVAALALSNGRPLIATQAGGLVDLVIPGKTGFVIAAPRVTDVKVALRAASSLSDQELRSMVHYCSTFFRSKYSWSDIAVQHRALYKQADPEAISGRVSPKGSRLFNQ